MKRLIDGNALASLFRTRRAMDGNPTAQDAFETAMWDAAQAEEITLNDLRDEVYQDALEHGLWDYPQYNRTRMISYVRVACVERIREELTEAVEVCDDPVAFARELTDAAITIFSTFGHLGIDMDKRFREVMAANKMRPWKHGKE